MDTVDFITTVRDLYGAVPQLERQPSQPLRPANPYHLPHADLRPHQGETIEWLLARQSGAVAIVQAPTGSGKTSFAAAMRAPVIALVKTKNLQIENYGGKYAFDVLYGRGNYPCVHPAADADVTAEECMYGSHMRECEFSDDCPYLLRKRQVVASARASLNYPYWLTANWPRTNLAEARGYLFCDEAHQLSDVVLDFVSVTITMRQRLDWDLPAFPLVRGRATADDVTACLAWLTASRGALAAAIRALKAELGVDDDDADPEDAPATGRKALPRDARRRKLKAARALAFKLQQVADALETNSTDWYLRSGPGARRAGDNPEPAFIARPLTARYHFPQFFVSPHWRTVLMSATVGDPAVLAEELGLPADYLYRDIPNQWSPASRPVYALPAPRMGYSTRGAAAAQAEHARVIADALHAVPRDWSGLILTTSKAEAWNLRERLAPLGLARRLHVPDRQHSTDDALQAWRAYRDRTPGALCITWNFWEGYDGQKERICIVAKTPFPSLGDDYERERMVYSNAFYQQRTAWQLEQGLGRTRRGAAEDYDLPGQRAGLVAIADGNWTRVQKHLSAGLRAAIVEGMPA